tara:strand:+ start:351 stop:1916 length:1566 start_codon:yes stop_codon:yes gene_type:complete
MFDKILNNRFFILYIIPFILGSLTVLSFQPFNFFFLNFITLPLFFYLIIFIKKKSKSIYRKKPFKKNLFIFGTAFGFGYFLSGIHWITNSLTFDENFKILIPFGIIFIPLFLSLFFSLTILILGPLLNLNFSSILILSGGLSVSDFIRAKILSGFPWNLWAYSFSWATEILQILNKIGLFAFNLISITIFMLPAIIFFNLKISKKFILLLSIPLFFLFFFIYGNYSINQNKIFVKSIKEKINIKVIAPNFELKYNLSIVNIQKRLDKLIRYSEPNKNIKTLFVWPEGVFSGYNYEELSILKEKFSDNFSENHFVLLGINRLSKNENGLYNSLIIVNKDFEIVQEYNKQKLVPFGEFLPLEKILNKFGLKKITEGYGSFLKGESQNNLILDNLNILPLICYEVIFTNLIQKSNNDTNLIINISEDGWFGNSIGPHQHFAKGVFRAIEHNSYLIRSANKGITAIIDNKGEIIKELNSRESGNIELEIPLIKSKNKNKNDLIFFVLLITYIFIFNFYKKNNGTK